MFEPITRFKVATVFDISQTEGRELPNIGVSELTGEVEHFTEIFDRLTELSPFPWRIFRERQRDMPVFKNSESSFGLV